ncbi:helix-turn-helix domain-containing protein [Legionella spiritensis]|uniref:DNA-binding protein n=1 Tax=Legionella spiritensis TaxID=452 RepID=A0A0W0YXT3_LEGSP|nr:helix-turn-helix domain-containing protein [Legionella spiritensis]KTD61676.1 DNA-binding protein [Legionella spiritensis]SNV38994.1 DNA-binding protein [Legionella spiritensis]VEG90311.1 DNA-binding protein [Legionella spiritensis]
MTTNTTVTDELSQNPIENPGAHLAHIREQKGYSREYVASKLHLRVKVIELLEAGDYEQMPEPVFVKGYFRAYAKLLDVLPEPYLASFNNIFMAERKAEKIALWQSRRETNRGERLVRWVSALVAISAIVAISFWWQKSNDGKLFFSGKQAGSGVALAKQPDKEMEVKLTDISKMQSMFRADSSSVSSEKKGG